MKQSARLRATGRNILILTIWFLYLVANIYVSQAAPYRPAGDDTLLTTLPVSGDPALRLLRERWRADPDEPATAVALARAYLRLERSEGDPRFLGYAQAILRPWWTDRKADESVAVTRAQLRARRHDFDEALAGLDGILSTQPHHSQALLSRAFILQSQGKITEAHAACQKLQRRLRSLVSAICLARMESLSGKSEQADRRLTRALNRSAGKNPAIRLWALTNLAEIAWRRGFPDRAEQSFRAALALDRRDAYLRDAYADLLLDLKRPADVRRLLEKDARADGHLLRLALAANALKDTDAARYIETLASRFAENRRRGEALHMREEARFELSLRHRPAKALELALENWRTQREPADSRLVLEAALAAGQPDKSREVLVWLRQTGLEDHTIRALAATIEETVR